MGFATNIPMENEISRAMNRYLDNLDAIQVRDFLVARLRRVDEARNGYGDGWAEYMEHLKTLRAWNNIQDEMVATRQS